MQYRTKMCTVSQYCDTNAPAAFILNKITLLKLWSLNSSKCLQILNSMKCCMCRFILTKSVEVVIKILPLCAEFCFQKPFMAKQPHAMKNSFHYR